MVWADGEAILASLPPEQADALTTVPIERRNAGVVEIRPFLQPAPSSGRLMYQNPDDTGSNGYLDSAAIDNDAVHREGESTTAGGRAQHPEPQLEPEPEREDRGPHWVRTVHTTLQGEARQALEARLAAAQRGWSAAVLEAQAQAPRFKLRPGQV